MFQVLLVEDSEDIVALVQANLDSIGLPLALDVALDGEQGLKKALAGDFVLAILDVDLPLLDGLSICRELRASGSQMPVLMLTGRDSTESKIEGLEVGADDYLTKPFSVHELCARIRAILRRSEFDPLSESNTQLAVGRNERSFAELRIDLDTREVWLGEQEIKLSKAEYDLLNLLSASPGRVYSRADLLEAVYGYQNANYESNINTLITRLRGKLEPSSAQPRFILTEWGVGYRFASEEELQS